MSWFWNSWGGNSSPLLSQTNQQSQIQYQNPYYSNIPPSSPFNQFDYKQMSETDLNLYHYYNDLHKQQQPLPSDQLYYNNNNYNNNKNNNRFFHENYTSSQGFMNRGQSLAGCSANTPPYVFAGLTAFSTTLTALEEFVFNGTTLDNIMTSLSGGSSADSWLSGSVVRIQSSQGYYWGVSGSIVTLVGVSLASYFTIDGTQGVGSTLTHYYIRFNNQFVFSAGSTFTSGGTGALTIGATGIPPATSPATFRMYPTPGNSFKAVIVCMGMGGITGVVQGLTGSLAAGTSALVVIGETTVGNTVDEFTFLFVDYPTLVLAEYLTVDPAYQVRCCINDYVLSSGLTPGLCNAAGLTGGTGACDASMICWCSDPDNITSEECGCFNDFSVIVNNGMTGSTGFAGSTGMTASVYNLTPSCAGPNCVAGTGYQTYYMSHSNPNCDGNCNALFSLQDSIGDTTTTQRGAAIHAAIQGASCGRQGETLMWIIIGVVLGVIVLALIGIAIWLGVRSGKGSGKRNSNKTRPKSTTTTTTTTSSTNNGNNTLMTPQGSQSSSLASITS